jgi:hypothetical protein
MNESRCPRCQQANPDYYVRCKSCGARFCDACAEAAAAAANKRKELSPLLTRFTPVCPGCGSEELEFPVD